MISCEGKIQNQNAIENHKVCTVRIHSYNLCPCYLLIICTMSFNEIVQLLDLLECYASVMLLSLLSNYNSHYCIPQKNQWSH